MIGKLRQLTKQETDQISIKNILLDFLTAFREDRSLQREARVHRLALELDQLRVAHPRAVGVHHPSSLHLGSNKPAVCPRRLAYGVRKQISIFGPVEPRVYNIFEVGHDAGAKYQGWLSYLYGEDFYPEVPLQIPELNVYGHCDGVIHYPINGEKVKIGLELKTINLRGFENDIKNRPTAKHLDQGALYMVGLDLPAMVFLYECKNTQEMKEFVITRDDVSKRWANIQQRLEHVNEHLEGGTLPRIRAQSWCHSCPFKVECRPFRTK